MGDAVLRMQNLSRCFGEQRAVDDVSIDIRPGSITGLIGPNGAGKTTLFNLLTGELKPDTGRVELMGKDITRLSPDKRFAAGLARTFQIPRPFKRMSVLENVMLTPLQQGGEGLIWPIFAHGRMAKQEAAIRTHALEVLDFVTLLPLADHAAGRISGGQTKLLELARVLMGNPKVILLDEPAAGVNPKLTETLIGKIEELNRTGTTFVIIEHDMDFVMRHCEPVIALAEGRKLFEGSAEAAQKSSLLLDAYLGASMDA